MGRPPPEGARVGYALGGLIGMCICNDRRWPEAYHVMGLQGVEMVLLGCNTPVHDPLGNFQNQLSMQAGVPEEDSSGKMCCLSKLQPLGSCFTQWAFWSWVGRETRKLRRCASSGGSPPN
jgi:Carbon-nitrogen hydrolase